MAKSVAPAVGLGSDSGDPCVGADLAVGGNRDTMADDGSGRDAGASSNARATRDDAAVEACTRFDNDAIPQQRVRDHGARANLAIVAQHGVRADDGIFGDAAAAANEYRRAQR